MIFYRLFTGNYPFESQDASKVVKMHIFEKLHPLHEIDPNIPIPLSYMISKLMEKNADLRYQSAKGIMHDLDLIISEYKPGLELVLGEHDISDTLILPQKLYGRDNQYTTLLEVHNKVKSSSSFELVFVEGNPGIGKTSLVSEINKDVIQDGIFVSGKYNDIKSEPYSAIIDAVNMFCDTIRLENKFVIEKYCALIQMAVGEEGIIIENVIKSLKYIIGEQPHTFESYGSEAKNRFNYVFVKFLKAIASISSPFTIVLEDLQWADLASIELITVLVKSSIKNLMLIVVYRGNEMQDKPELVRFLHEIKSSSTEIKLDNIDNESLNSYVSDTLRLSPLVTYPLSAFLYEKTNGNPFFITQLINSLLEKKIIIFALEKSEWQWDQSILEKDVVVNIAHLLKQKVLSLSEQAQQALKIASILKSPFSISSLALIMGDNKGVEDALESGILTRHEGCDKCRFVHDQYNNAASCLLSENRKQVCLDVARKLLQLRSKVGIDENTADITNLYQNAKDMIEGSERFEVAKVFQAAGEKALISTAFGEALKYFESGIEILGSDKWDSRYTLCLGFYCNAAKSAYCKADYEKMNEFIQEISQNTKTVSELITSTLLQIRMYSDKLLFEDAISSALSMLERLGEQIHFDETTINSEIEETTDLITKSFHDISNMTEMEDTEQLSIMKVLHCVSYSSFCSGNYVAFATIAMKMVRFSLNYGISKYSCQGFSSFAVILCRMGNHLSRDIGRLSLELLDRSSKEFIPTVNICIFTLISPFYEPICNVLRPLRKTSLISLENGLHHYSSNSITVYYSFAFHFGEKLGTLYDEMGQFDEVLRMKTKQFMATKQAIINLQDVYVDNPHLLCGNEFDYNCCLDENQWKGDDASTLTLCCLIAYLFDNIKKASEMVEHCKAIGEKFPNSLSKVLFYFYDGLITSSKILEGKDESTDNITEIIEKIGEYTENSPENYLNKYYLLKAELSVILNDESEAKKNFEKAISLSKENRLLCEQAIAAERAAKFYFKLGSKQEAKVLLFQSYNCYREWGAMSKIYHMANRYPLIVCSLKESSCELTSIEGNHENFEIIDDSMQSVSIMTDAFSLHRIKKQS